MIPNAFALFLMVFAHIYDDYYKQSILASMKQKTWWKRNAPAPMYRFDYIAALIAHAFSWAFMIMLPIAIMYSFDLSPSVYAIALVVNMIVHAIVDDLKANRNKINLVTDQLIHIIQIVLTWFYFAL